MQTIGNILVSVTGGQHTSRSWVVSGCDGQGTDGQDVSQQVLHRSKDRHLGLDPNSFRNCRRTDAEESIRLWLEPISFSVGRRTDTWDSSRIGLDPNSFAVGQRTDVWDSIWLGLKSIHSSRLGLESINSLGNILCIEISCLTVLGTRELTRPRRMCAMAHCANSSVVYRYVGRINWWCAGEWCLGW